MSTLKICSQKRAYWITDVRTVERLTFFDVPSEFRKLPEEGLSANPRTFRRKQEKAIVAAAIEACDDDMAVAIQIAEFWDEEVGQVIRVKQYGAEDKIWIVPANGTFLMSDAGKTIDRI